MPPAIGGSEAEAVAVRLEAKAREAVPALEAREARRLASLHTTEERPEGEVEPLERDLRRLGVDREERRILLTDLRQALALVGERDRDASHAIRLDTLLKGSIVKRAVQLEQALKRTRLLQRRVQLIRHAPIDLARHASYFVVMRNKMSSFAGFFTAFMHLTITQF